MNRIKYFGTYIVIQLTVYFSFTSVLGQFTGNSKEFLDNEHYSNLVLQLYIFSSLCTGLVAFLLGHFFKIKPLHTFIMYFVSGVVFNLIARVDYGLSVSSILSEMTEFLVPYACIGYGIYKCTEYLKKNQVRPKH